MLRNGLRKGLAIGAACALVASGAARAQMAAPMFPGVAGSAKRTGAAPAPRKSAGTASDQGASYAAIRYGTTVAPPSTGQSSLAGRSSDRIFVGTPPINPALGSRLVSGQRALADLGHRLNPHVGDRQLLIASGQRIGGDGDPSREAVTYDPRDILEYRVKALETPGATISP